MSGSPLKCCWINKINDSILTAVPSGFFFFQNTKFVCLYWAYSIRGWGLLGILWCCLCISNWPLICFECFVFLLSRFTLLLSNTLHESKRKYSSWFQVTKSNLQNYNLLGAARYPDLPWRRQQTGCWCHIYTPFKVFKNLKEVFFLIFSHRHDQIKWKALLDCSEHHSCWMNLSEV